MNSYDTKTWAWEAQINAIKSELEVQAAENRRLRAALRGAEAWLQTWAVHVGTCRGGNQCTCGLTFMRFDARAALEESGTEAQRISTGGDE